jgi:hypothetical protein
MTKHYVLAALLLAGCSDATGSPTGGGDAGSDTGTVADTYTPPVDTGPSCSGLSGTYSATRKRSTGSPGSCPSTYSFVPNFPIRIAVDSTAASGYKMELGYTDSTTGAITFIACASVNVSGCTIYATCKPSVGTDQATFTIDGNNVTGKIERSDTDRSCTITFDVTGKRQ